MAERIGAITMKGNPLTLIGHEIKVGDQAPDAVLVANDLSEVKLSSFKGKKVILSVVPSLDTPVCDLQTKRFNQEASQACGCRGFDGQQRPAFRAKALVRGCRGHALSRPCRIIAAILVRPMGF